MIWTGLTAGGLVAVVLADAAAPGWGELARLGVIALAMVVGAGGAYKFQVVHERAQTAKEEARAVAAEAKYDRLMEAFMGDLSPAMLKLTSASEEFSAASAQNADLMKQLISAVLSVLGKG